MNKGNPIKGMSEIKIDDSYDPSRGGVPLGERLTPLVGDATTPAPALAATFQSDNGRSQPGVRAARLFIGRYSCSVILGCSVRALQSMNLALFL